MSLGPRAIRLAIETLASNELVGDELFEGGVENDTVTKEIIHKQKSGVTATALPESEANLN